MAIDRAWTVWGLEATISVTRESAASSAEDIVRRVIHDVDKACSRFRSDSELQRIQPRLEQGAHISPLLATLVQASLDAARITDGDVDPTLGTDMAALGYDRDITEISLDASTGAVLGQVQHRTPVWRDIRLHRGLLTVPGGVELDLGATAKAVAADRAAAEVFGRLGCGALVSLGGDIASSGPAPDEGWQIMVQDLPEDPSQQVTLQPGKALATSSTQKRSWHHAGQRVHHILDPRFGLPAETVWKSVTAAGASCLLANAYSTAAVVRGFAAVDWFQELGIAGRFVDARGGVVTTGSWPKPAAWSGRLPAASGG